MSSPTGPSAVSTDRNRSEIEDFIENVGASLQDGLLPARVFNDQDVFQLELERVFGKSWLFVGHESEIPDPGDYAQRYLGTDPFIFVRDEKGEINVLFDSCRHHGAKLCKAEQGNTSHFRCSYHGWTYKNSGELTGVPQKDECFKELDREDWGLHEAPRVDSYEGLIFASLAEEGPTLEEYLGPFKWYLDIQFKLGKGGVEVVGEPHRWRVDADWKTGADNFSADSYHTPWTHRSVLDVGFASEDFSGMPGRFNSRHITHIHTGSISLRLHDTADQLFFAHPAEYVTDDHLTDDQFDIAAASGVNVGTLFPNFSFIHAAYTDDPNESLNGMFSIRQWRPIAPGKMEMWSWVLAPVEAPEEYKRRVYDIAVANFSPSGNFEQDDLAIWNGMSEVAKSTFTRKVGHELNYQMGLDNMSRASLDPNWPGPGAAWDDNLEEGTMRTFYYNWYKAMSGQEPGVEFGVDIR